MDEPTGNSSPRKMMSMLLQHSEPQQTNTHVPPFESVYNFYHQQTPDDIKSMLIGNLDDPLIIAKQFALLALQQSRELLPIGRGNIYEDIIPSEGLSHKNTKINRDMSHYAIQDKTGVVCTEVKSGYKARIEGDTNPDRLDTQSKFMALLLVKSHLTLHYQAGNCNEFAFIALQCLFELKRKLGNDFDNIISNMSVMDSGDPEHHVYLALEVKINDQKTRIICDPWAGFVGRIEDLPEGFKVAGKDAQEIYSENGKKMYPPYFINKIYNCGAYNGSNLSCFDMYHQMLEGTVDDPYYTFLRTLPDDPNFNYDDCDNFLKINKLGLFYDYNENSKKTYTHLMKVDPEEVPALIEGLTQSTPYYSQPDHPDLHFKPIPQNLNNSNNQDMSESIETVTTPEISTSPNPEEQSNTTSITNNEPVDDTKEEQTNLRQSHPGS